MLKTFIAIMSHHESKIDRRQIQDERFISFFFVGDPNQQDDFVVDESNQTVCLKVPDNYESLPMKVSAALRFAHEKYGDLIGGVFKTDDDIELRLDKLHEIVERNKHHQYFGIVRRVEAYESDDHFGKCQDPETNKTKQPVPTCVYCPGGGYYLAKNLLPLVYGSDQVCIFEDANVGKIMNMNGVKPTHVPIKTCAFWKTPVSLRQRQHFPYCDCGHIVTKGLNLCPHCDKRY